MFILFATDRSLIETSTWDGVESVSYLLTVHNLPWYNRLQMPIGKPVLVKKMVGQSSTTLLMKVHFHIRLLIRLNFPHLSSLNGEKLWKPKKKFADYSKREYMSNKEIHENIHILLSTRYEKGHQRQASIEISVIKP